MSLLLSMGMGMGMGMGACAQAPAASAAHFTRQPQAHAQDGITLALPAQPGGRCAVTITQRFGIGAAQVMLPAACHGADLMLRFRHAPGQPFRSLEMLELGAEGALQRPRRDALHRSGDALELTLPAAWLKAAMGGEEAPGVIELSWIDAYRG